METKKQFRWFSIFEYEKEQEYLREMHKKGWKLINVKGFGVYYFEKCMPQDVVYQLDYNEAVYKNKDEYVQMFTDCGWEYLFEYAGYSYFRKPVKNGISDEIFCDDESRLMMMQRVFKGRMIPLLVIFFCLLLPQLIMHLFPQPDYTYVSLFGGLLVIYLVFFTMFAVNYYRFKNNMKRG